MTELRLVQAETESAGLRVRWSDAGAEKIFPWFWLRDHGEDEASLDPVTLQRRVDTFAIPTEIRGVAAQVENEGATVAVSWNDNSPPSTYSARFLARMAGLAPTEAEFAPGLTQRLWTATGRPNPLPSVAYGAVMDGDDDLRRLLENIHVWGFCLVEGVPGSTEGTASLVGRIGYVRETIFGGVSVLSADETEHKDTAYSTDFLEPHTDGTYFADAPGLQLFNCIETDARGGESILVDGFAAAEGLRAEEPANYEALTRIAVAGRYVEPRIHLRAQRPPLRLDDRGRLAQISFNNYDRAPFLLADDEMVAFYRAYAALHRRLNDRDSWLTVALRPGMVLIFDNWRVLHGRMAYAGKRVYNSCYLNREDFESRLRVLREDLRADRDSGDNT
jgi:trimethyllysine dioxygenase